MRNCIGNTPRTMMELSIELYEMANGLKLKKKIF